MSGHPLLLNTPKSIASPSTFRILRFTQAMRGQKMSSTGKPQKISGAGQADTRSCFHNLGAHFRYLGSTSPKTSGGAVVSYKTTGFLSPVELYDLVCGGKQQEKMKAFEYAELFRVADMTFAPKQVSDILKNPAGWTKFLDLEGRVNIFPVWDGEETRLILAWRYGSSWKTKDSRFDRGRGTKPGARIVLRNAHP